MSTKIELEISSIYERYFLIFYCSSF